MTEDVGRRPATVAEARALLGAPKRGEVSRRDLLTHPIEASS
jgi:gas vesicle protein